MRRYGAALLAAPLLATVAEAAHVPRAVTFEVDGVLWPFEAGRDTVPPYAAQPEGLVQDVRGRPLRACPDAAAVLMEIKSMDRVVSAIASRAERPEATWQLLETLVPDTTDGRSLGGLVDYKQIHPGEKFQHLERLLPRMSLNDQPLAFKDVLHFDSSERNIRTAAKLGVTCYHVTSGCISMDDFNAGLSLWQTNNPLPTPSPSPSPSPAPPRTGNVGDAGAAMAAQFD